MQSRRGTDLRRDVGAAVGEGLRVMFSEGTGSVWHARLLPGNPGSAPSLGWLLEPGPRGAVSVSPPPEGVSPFVLRTSPEVTSLEKRRPCARPAVLSEKLRASFSLYL